MALRKMLSCSYCKTDFPREELEYVTKTTKLCKECKKVWEENAVQYKKLMADICELFKVKAPTKVQVIEVNRLKEEGYTYLQIRYALYYCFKVLDIPFNENETLGILAYKIKDSTKLMNKVNESRNKLRNRKIDLNKVTTIKVNMPIDKSKGSIDLNSLDMEKNYE